METFKISIQERLSKTINIQAKNISEALYKTNEMYHNEEIVLDYDDLISTEIISNDSINEKEELTLALIEYLEHNSKDNLIIVEKAKKLKTLL